MAGIPVFKMPSITGPPLQPWEYLDYTKRQEQILYRDWGVFFSYKQKIDIASKFYDKSLEINQKDPKALYFRSICKINMAEGEAALKDILAAEELVPYSPRICKAIADVYNGINEFEKSKIELHNITRKLSGPAVNDFLGQIDMLDRNLEHILGDNLHNFFRKHGKFVENVAEKIKQEKIIDKRLLWKKLKADEKCDVLSILEKEEKNLSSLALARRERSLRIFYQIYMDQVWKDVILLRSLRKDKTFCIPQFKESSPLLFNLVTAKYGIVKKFIKMVEARNPLYNERLRKFPNKAFKHQYHENYLNFVQYQTRRKMIAILRKIKFYREEGEIELLAKYIEKCMTDFVPFKTHRVMPWKFEFINEVYNTFALTFTDNYIKIDNNYNKNAEEGPQNELLRLLSIQQKVKDHPIGFEFGKQSTSDFENERKFNVYKQFIGHLETRMTFAKYSIEKCYLWHEMARTHFKNGHYDECCQIARKAIDEACSNNKRLWQFLSVMLIVKSHATLDKIERCKDAMLEAYNCAFDLKSDQLCQFVDNILLINDFYIDLKKKSRSQDTIRKRRTSTMTLGDSTDDNYSKEPISSNVSEGTLKSP